jgi:hypothetical protein
MFQTCLGARVVVFGDFFFIGDFIGDDYVSSLFVSVQE